MANPSGHARRAARSARPSGIRSFAVTLPPGTRGAAHHAAAPLGVLMLAASLGSFAQTEGATGGRVLPTVTVQDRAEAPQGKETLNPPTTRIGKGEQSQLDIPQSMTTVTEKLIRDRNLDTLKEALHNTGGITFQAAEGGEEDIRLRGFSLATTGDIFVDAIRDPAFYDRDVFNLDRIELLRGPASMLFGRGSTGGVVNQVSKLPRLATEHEVVTTVGNHAYRRIVGDFNLRTGEGAALRFNVMHNKADNNGAGSSIDKHGFAPSYSWGIGGAHEFNLSYFYLDNDNGINYGLPYIRPTAASPVGTSGLIRRLDPKDYFGAASDFNKGRAQYATFSHVWRSDAGELRTAVRRGNFDRDQRASTVRFAGVPANPAAVGENNISDNTVFTRGTQNKIQNLRATYAQSDFSTKFETLGLKHAVLAGLDFSEEDFTGFQGGNIGAKPNTRVGSPEDGLGVNEQARPITLQRTFKAINRGVYAQDLLQFLPQWKLLLGLRYDNFDGQYFLRPGTRFERDDSLWSKRAGLLFNPNPLTTIYASYGTSFNTSGDAFQFDLPGSNTPPEKSRNVELGVKADLLDGRLSTRAAIFKTTKYNERNRDSPAGTPLTDYLLSGARYARGVDFDVAGHISARWDVFLSYTWIPSARITQGNPDGTTLTAERVGDRPSLTPRHSGTAFATYRITPQVRVGGGLNFRSGQQPNRNPGFEAPGFVTADLLAEYLVNPDLAIKFNIINVANKLYADSLYTSHYIPGPGRLFQLSVGTKF